MSVPGPHVIDPSPPESAPVSARAEGPPVERPDPPLTSPRLVRFVRALGRFFAWLWRGPSGYVKRYLTSRDPTFRNAFVPFLALTAILYTRLPTTNYIFDEQEALLANPYVNQVGFKYEDAIYRDFWGLPPNASIGSYRPVPNYLWRGLVEVGERGQRQLDKSLPAEWKAKLPKDFPPLTDVARRSFFQHFYNIFFHAINGAIFTAMAWALTRRRLHAWLVGTTFVTCAVLTEAVSGCVGLADVLGGMGALLALAAIGLPAYAMPFGVFLAVLFGLFSKESAVVCVPLVPFAALVAAPVVHPDKPARFPRAVLAAVGSIGAFVIYVEMRKRWFPSPLPSELSEALPDSAGTGKKLAHEFLVWFHQAPLPRDPLNNPFADPKVTLDERIAGALRVYERGLGQVVFPWTLSGDYSFPQEPAPTKLVFPGSVLGAILTIVPLCAAVALWVVALLREGLGLKRGTSADDGGEPRVDRVEARWKRVTRRVLRHAFEVSLALGTWLLVRKMLKIPAAPDAEEQIAKNIAIPLALLSKWVPIVCGASFATGLAVELGWKKRPHVGGLFRLSLVSVGLLWLVVSYFPHSNVPVLLPTVRAERLWYFPVIGTTIVIATALDWIHEALSTTTIGAPGSLLRRVARRGAVVVPAAFLGFQALRAYWHATDYRSDLVFWEATKDAVPRSAKAHLNYSVMVGAHSGDYQTRLLHSMRAIELAPDWAMAHIYTGDTLCRMGRAPEAWPHYETGFEKGPADKGLISLALQCMYDQKILKAHDAELRKLAADHPGSWLAYLAVDTLDNGDSYGGVNPEYRPRSYNEGPTKKKTAKASASTSSSAEDSASASESEEAAAESASATEKETAASSSASASARATSTR